MNSSESNCNIYGAFPCEMCPDKKMAYFIDESELKSKPSGLFTSKGARNAMFNCSPNMMYDSRQGPDACLTKCKITDINEQMGIKKSVCFNQDDPNTCGYTKKWDGRLIDAARNMKIGLDTPPYEGDIGKLKNVYSEKLKDYKTGYYNSYDDIKTGQIKYYSNSELAGAYPKRTGNYIIRATEDYEIYKDPMDGMELHTSRQPLTVKRPEYLCGPNFMKDSISHREDLMSKQSYLVNNNSFEARYGNMYKDKM